MAEKKVELFEHYLTCPVCLETFRDPVSLSCNHSFCSNCLKEFWKENENKNCPVCRRKSSKDHLDVNFALKELADSFAERLNVGSSETEKGEKKVEVVCSKHPEEPKLFCKDENRAVCSVCDVSVHDTHTVVPVEEAVTEMKDQLKSDLKSLREKKNKYKETEETYDEIIQHLKKQVLFTESQIRAEFNKLHQFLKEEEESRLAALREEEQQKRRSVMRELKRIEEQMSSVSDSICAVEEELQKASAPFLISCKDTQSRARAQCSVSEPQLISGALIHVDKHLGNLSFRVWEKMRSKVHFSRVILDPNTAHGWLRRSGGLRKVSHGDPYQASFSDLTSGINEDLFPASFSDLTSATYEDPYQHFFSHPSSETIWPVSSTSGQKPDKPWKVHQLITEPTHTKQHLPDDPESNIKYVSVHGFEGFHSGKHCWDVEVGDHPEWTLGVAKESVDKKGERFASPIYGIWCLKHRNGEYSNGLGRTVTVQTSPQRIRVELDYDRGKVSFYNAEDKTHIYTHTDIFIEKLYPYFYLGKFADAKTIDVKSWQRDFSVGHGKMKM